MNGLDLKLDCRCHFTRCIICPCRRNRADEERHRSTVASNLHYTEVRRTYDRNIWQSASSSQWTRREGHVKRRYPGSNQFSRGEGRQSPSYHFRITEIRPNSDCNPTHTQANTALRRWQNCRMIYRRTIGGLICCFYCPFMCITMYILYIFYLIIIYILKNK